MLGRFLFYGLCGLSLEVVFTGISSALFRRDRAATGHTYLWMLPIYGGAGLLLEAVRSMALGAPLLLRAALYVAVIFAVEYVSGALLRLLIGRCPWDYGRRGLSVHGLIRLDYAPAWFVAGLLFEWSLPVAMAAQAVLPGQLHILAALGGRG